MSGKPKIILGPHLDETVDEVIAALAKRPDVFVHNGALVKVAGGRICRLPPRRCGRRWLARLTSSRTME